MSNREIVMVGMALMHRLDSKDLVAIRKESAKLIKKFGYSQAFKIANGSLLEAEAVKI